MRPLFKDPELQARFDEDGYVKVPMLDRAEVDRLLEFYRSLPEEPLPEYGFHVSLDKQDRAAKESVIAELKAVIGPKAAGYFDRFRIFTGSFVVKEHNPKGVVPPHQDWTFVDESRFNSVTCWTALMDVDMDNGCMGVIKGSHRFWDYVRASPSPQCKTPISDHMFTIFPYLQLVPMKAGESLIFDNRTIHASPPNTTETPRIAAGIGITQEEAELVHHYLVPGSEPAKLARYAADLDFFLQYNNGRLSELYGAGKMPESVTVLGETVRALPEFTDDELLDLIKSHPGNTMNAPLVEKMARLFNYNPDGTKKEEPAPVTNGTSERTGGLRGFIKRIFG